MRQNRGSVTVIGMGPGPADLTEAVLQKIYRADILAGGRRQLGFFPDFSGERLELGKDPGAALARLARKLHARSAVVLASGDPNFHGIAELVYRHFEHHPVTVIPNITAFQAACARLHMPWSDAHFVSVHGRDISGLNRILRRHGTFIIYCDHINTPARAARYLISARAEIGTCPAWVCDSLGSDAERVVEGSLKAFRSKTFSPLCMMILKNDLEEPVSPLGIDDGCFVHRGGLITRKDIRILALSRLGLQRARTLWDIGAGSGSLSIEAALQYPEVQVYAVEKNTARWRELKKNIRTFSVPAVVPLQSRAPEGLNDAPAPDSVFIGGSDDQLKKILQCVERRLAPGGSLVVNCVQPDTLHTVLTWLRKQAWRYEATSVQLSSLSSDKNPEIFRAQNPVYIVHGKR